MRREVVFVHIRRLDIAINFVCRGEGGESEVKYCDRRIAYCMFNFLNLSHSLAAAMANMARLDAVASGTICALWQAGVKREDIARKVRKNDGKRPPSAQAL